MNKKIESINSQKLNYHLFAGLETLRNESGEWISSILFWQDEIKFLKKLIMNNSNNLLPIKISDGFRKTKSMLNFIKSYELPDLYKDIEQHKLYLEFMIEDKSNEHESYRRFEHKDLLQKTQLFTTRFKELKMEIFELINEVVIVNFNIDAHYWKGFIHFQLDKVVTNVSNVINRYGNILNSNFFSDIEISFIIEIQGGKVAELYNELSNYIRLDPEILDVINPYKKCKIFLNITYTVA